MPFYCFGNLWVNHQLLGDKTVQYISYSISRSPKLWIDIIRQLKVFSLILLLSKNLSLSCAQLCVCLCVGFILSRTKNVWFECYATHTHTSYERFVCDWIMKQCKEWANDEKQWIYNHDYTFCNDCATPNYLHEFSDAFKVPLSVSSKT